MLNRNQLEVPMQSVSWPVAAVQALLATLFAKEMIVVPMAVFSDSAEPEQLFSADFRPTHAGEFHAVFDEMATSGFDDTGSDRPAALQVGGVIHVLLVLLKVTDHLEALFTASRFATVGLGSLLEEVDESRHRSARAGSGRSPN